MIKNILRWVLAYIVSIIGVSFFVAILCSIVGLAGYLISLIPEKVIMIFFGIGLLIVLVVGIVGLIHAIAKDIRKDFF